MDKEMERMIENIFNSCAELDSHPLDLWIKWIIKKHPELVNQMIEEITDRTDLTEDDLPAAYMAAGTALLFAGSQLFFDVVTGVIYGKGKVHFETSLVLHNLGEVKQRAHELVDQTFDQYTKKFSKERENEVVEEGSEIEEEDSNLYRSINDEDYRWEEVTDSDLDEGEE